MQTCYRCNETGHQQSECPRKKRLGNSQADKMLKLKELKTKIVRLNSPYRQRVMIDTEEHDQITGEYPSLHHLLNRRKRQEGRLIRQIVDENDETHTTSASILRTFAKHFQQTLQPIESKEQSLKQLTESGLRTITPGMR